MGGITLDELLAGSGISSLTGETEKVASEEDAQSDETELVSALRKFAESKEPEPENIKAAAAKELVEKTAEILIIKKTLDEIEKIANIVEPEGINKTAAFIKTALDQGHSEKEIAQFLKKAQGRIGRALEATKLRLGGRTLGRKALKFSDEVLDKEYRLLRDTMVRGKPGEIAKRLAETEGKLGRNVVEGLVLDIKNDIGRIPSVARGYLPRGGKKYTLKSPSGKETHIPTGTVGTAAKVGGGATAGVMIGRRGNSKSDKSSGAKLVML